MANFNAKIDINKINDLKKYFWQIRYDRRYPKHYVETWVNKKRLHLHRYLMGVGFEKYTYEKTIDHINGDTLDNRICNLKLCSKKENSKNIRTDISSGKSGIRYLTWCNTINRWKVVYKSKYLKCFKKLEDAKKYLDMYRKTLNNY